MALVDTYIVYRFIKQLVTPWDETEAFKNGVIDAKGKLLIDTNKLSDKQSSSYTLFDRLVMNIKRLIELVPGGKSKLGSYAAALFLLREELSYQGVIILEKTFLNFLKDSEALDSSYLTEQYLPEELLSKGEYKLLDSMLDTKGDSLPKHTVVIAVGNLKPLARILGVDVYQLRSKNNPNKIVVVSKNDISDELVEDEGVATNNVGSGNIAGVGVGKDGQPNFGEPGVPVRKKLEIVGPEPVDPKLFFGDFIFNHKSNT